VIIKRFNLAYSSEFILQYFDEEWQSYVEDCLVDKTKLCVTSVPSVDVNSAVSAERVDNQEVYYYTTQ